jgi:hypothetical protein
MTHVRRRGLAELWTGRPKRGRDDTGRVVPRGIAQKCFLQVNGTRQGMFLRGRDPANPIVLYLHGGLPEYFLTERRPTMLEDSFTVAWWEQRGSGLSCNRSLPRA